jgi:hypothetical protein
VLADGLQLKESLALAVLENEVLFSVQDGPFQVFENFLSHENAFG